MLDCIWPINTDNCCEAPADESPGDPDEIVVRLAGVASSILTRLSGYTIGLCEATVRPLDICKVCRGWCCGGADGIRLSGPMGLPVYDVTAVRLGPVEYPLSDWRYDREKNTLWHTPPGSWPTRDERWSDCGEGDAFCVDIVTGTPPDAWALNVAETLTCELVASCRPGSKCRLPKNATQITAQGVTVQLRDDEISLFLPEVAAWVHAVNPYGARLPARVWSPDLRGDHLMLRRTGDTTISIPDSFFGGTPLGTGPDSMDGGTPVLVGPDTISGGTP